MARLFIFGLGYTASRIKTAMEKHGWQVDASGRSGNVDFADTGQVSAALEQASHVLSSIPPERASGHDLVVERYGKQLGRHELFYLSSTGVYGDAGGAWVDEGTPSVLETGKGRRKPRAQADKDWLGLSARVFRLPGIYGPGRSALDRVREGKARRIDLPTQVFSRVHVDDIVSGVEAALLQNAPAGAYNLADDVPASGNLVTEYACHLLGAEPPGMESLEEANLSPMARGFYAENRRIANGKAKRVLGWQPKFANYIEGLESLI